MVAQPSHTRRFYSNDSGPNSDTDGFGQVPGGDPRKMGAEPGAGSLRRT
jgi:hypothetical protein